MSKFVVIGSNGNKIDGRKSLATVYILENLYQVQTNKLLAFCKITQ